MKWESIESRFARCVRKLPGDNGCWEWTGSLNHNGYGMVWDHEHMTLAHRVSWRLHIGPIPLGKYVCHHCDNRPCVRPDHLFLGTQFDNMRDCSRKGRIVAPRGEQTWCSKLTDQEVREIRIARARGATVTALAERYRLAKNTVFNIVARRNWRHVA